MPYKAMADKGETIVLTKLYKTVGIVPEETVFFRMNLLRTSGT